MNIANEVLKWINAGCNYADGVKIYLKNGTSDTLKQLFTQYSTRYYKDKLYQELINLKVNFENEQVFTPVEVKEMTSRIDNQSAPGKIKDLNIEKSRLFTSILKNRSEIKKLIKVKTKGRISLADALLEMERLDKYKRPIPFSLTFITYSKVRGIGGDVVRYPSCILRYTNNTGSKIIKDTKKRLSRQPAHWKNSTRNFQVLGDKSIKKFHIWLLIEFNGMEVVISDVG